MQRIHQMRLLAYPADALFEIITDIRAYPAFLPKVKEVFIHEQNQQHTLASLIVEHAGIRQSITTKNQLIEPFNLSIQLIEGPLEKLSGHWRLVALSDTATQVEFSAEFKLRRLLQIGMNTLLKQITEQTLDQFELRAKTLLAYNDQKN